MEETLGKRIVSHRKRLGLTQDQLAERLGITAQAVSKWEHDLSCPDITMLPLLAQIFGTTTDALLGMERETVHPAELVSLEEADAPGDIHLQSGSGNWEFHWDSGRRGSVGMAVLVLLVGGLMLAGHFLAWDVNFWGLLWPCALLIFGLWGLYPRFGFFRMGCVLFGGYFLAQELDILPAQISGGIVFPLVLVLFGLSLLADALRKPSKPRFRIRKGSNDHRKFSSSFRADGECFSCETSFGSDSRLITLPRLSGGQVECSFGELTVDLSGCATAAPDCRLEIDASFGSVIVICPGRFRLETDSDTTFGTVEICGSPAPDALPIRLDCDVSFGSVTIHYM